MSIDYAVPAVAGTLGASIITGSMKSDNRSFLLGSGAVSTDRVQVYVSTDGGTTFAPLMREIEKTPVILSVDLPEATVDDNGNAYKMKRLVVGVGSTLAHVHLNGTANPSDSPEPIRHQIPTALTASFTALRQIARFFVARRVTGIYVTFDSDITADASNNFDVLVKVLDAAGAVVGTLGSYNTGVGSLKNVANALTLASSLQNVPATYSLAWVATETGTATLPIGLIEITWE